MAWHSMRRNHKSETPSQVISIGYSARQADPESEMSLACVYAIADRRRGGQWVAHAEEGFHDGGSLWAWIRRRLAPRQPAWIFCNQYHIAAILTGLWDEFEDDRFQLGIPEREGEGPEGEPRKIAAWNGLCCIEPKPFCVYAVCHRGVAKCVDVRNYFDMTDEELLAAGGSDHIVESPWDRDATAHKWHAEVTAGVVHRLMTGLIHQWNEVDRGNWQPTAGRMAVGNWRHSFMPEHAFQWDPEKLDRKYHRSALYGGEIRAWKTGKIDGPVYHVDCRSMYANVLRSCLFPWKVIEAHDYGTILGSTRPSYPDECIATVQVFAGGNTPCRDTNGKVYYPTARTITTLAGPELAELDRAGMIEEWFRWERFAMAPMFREFSTYWLAIRDQAKSMGDAYGDALAKMMLNSLGGKLAARSALWKSDTRWKPPMRWGTWTAPCPERGTWTQWRAIAGHPQRQCERVERKDTYPAATAWITACGREYMRTVRSLLPPDSVLCQQTDSWLLTSEGYDALRSSLYWNDREPGCFRLIGEYAWVDIWGPNHYRGDGVNCMSGLPHGSEPIGDHRWKVLLPETTFDYVRRGGGDKKVAINPGEFWLNRDGGSQEFGVRGPAYE